MVRAQYSYCPPELNVGEFSMEACSQSCCGLLEAIDIHHLGEQCCKQLLSDGAFEKLGEGIAGDWVD
jgi:hypothetical protein